jgi:hypothetical protein
MLVERLSNWPNCFYNILVRFTEWLFLHINLLSPTSSNMENTNFFVIFIFVIFIFVIFINALSSQMLYQISHRKHKIQWTWFTSYTAQYQHNQNSMTKFEWAIYWQSKCIVPKFTPELFFSPCGQTLLAPELNVDDLLRSTSSWRIIHIFGHCCCPIMSMTSFVHILVLHYSSNLVASGKLWSQKTGISDGMG